MIRRTYGCDKCGFVWTHEHASGNEPFIDVCPRCAGSSAWQPQPVNIGFNRPENTSLTVPDSATKRIDLAARIAMEDHDATNLRSGMQLGDKAAIDKPATASSARFEKVQEMLSAASSWKAPHQADNVFSLTTGSRSGAPPPPNVIPRAKGDE